jgi:hypothetical protein
MPGVSFQSRPAAVGHPEQPLSDVRRADATSRKRVTLGYAVLIFWHSIAERFQVSIYSGEPFDSKASANLLAKDSLGPALCEEPPKSGP